jgi:hypothetical protein
MRRRAEKLKEMASKAVAEIEGDDFKGDLRKQICELS